MEHAKLGSVISFNKTLRLNRTLRGPAESIKIWLGRTLSITTHHVKITSQKIVNVFIRVFKNLPQSLKSGYGMGFIGVLISGTLLTTAVCLNPKKHTAIKVVLIIASIAFLCIACAVACIFRGKFLPIFNTPIGTLPYI